MPAVKARKKIEEVETTQVERLLVSSRFVLCDELTRQIKAVEARLEEEANKEERAQLLMTSRDRADQRHGTYSHARRCSTLSP
ncbi:MAG: hypothetical protein IPQ00_02500 [Chloracidobacterium sp.]|nr:hypothetical protein [Chloracidobacterium sp.]